MGQCVICQVNGGNTGTKCDILHEAQVGEWFQHAFDSDGNENYIDPATFNQAALTALINHADPKKRLYPIQDIKTVTGERTEGDVEEFDDKTKNRFDNGIRTNSYLINKGNPVLLGNLKSLLCPGSEMRAYIIEKNGNIAGVVKNNDGYLYGMAIDTNSVFLNWVKGAQAAMQKISVTYDYSPSMLDENIRLISISGTDLKTLATEGLQNLVATISNITITGATLKLQTEYGSLGKLAPVLGLVSAEMVSFDGGATGKIYNSTDDADVTVTVTETATPGEYTLAWVAQTSADVLKLAIKKNGYDDVNINGTSITIP